MNEKGKLVFNSFIAKQLLTKYNHRIIDLKKHRDSNNVIFVFENNMDIDKDIQEIKNNSMKGDKNDVDISENEAYIKI